MRMIIEENNGFMPLPLYDVKEVTVEEAWCLLSNQQKYSGETLFSRAGNRLRLHCDADKLHRTIETFFSV